MRTLMLLALAIVAVTESRRFISGRNELHFSQKMEEILLEEIIYNVDDMMLNQISKKNLNQFVKDIFPQAGCSKKHLCQAAMAMMHTNLNCTKLHRQLSAYANISGHHHCKIRASEEHRMEVFLTKIKECSQEQYSKLKNTRAVK